LRSAAAANLLLVHLQSVAVLHIELRRVSNIPVRVPLCVSESRAIFLAYRVWVVLRCYTLPVEQEAHARDVLALAIAECVHKLAQGCGALDLEEDLVVVVRDLDVQVLALAAIFRLLLDVW
jgi:hypothetical protein